MAGSSKSSGFDAIVLAGGASRRMAGGDSAPVGSVPVGSVPVGSVPVGSVPVDKAVLRIGEARLLDRAVSAAAAAETIVVVGPRRPIEVFADRVVWTRERPAGSGPAAGIVHALALVVQSRVVVLAVDAPFTASAVPRLVDALAGEPQVALDGEGDTESAEAAMLVDASGRRQPLIACYATQALRRRAAGEVWTDRSVRALVDGLRVTEVTALGAESLDCDTPEDVEAARAVIGADAARAPGVGVPGVSVPGVGVPGVGVPGVSVPGVSREATVRPLSRRIANSTPAD